MAAGFLWGEAVREDRLSPCYVFFGEETYLAEQFIRRLKTALMSPDAEGFNLERFDIEETRWPDIIDVARTAPFFFSPWRIVVVDVPEEMKNEISSLEKSIIKDYLLSPPAKTILVVIVAGRVKKSHPLVRLVSSLPRTVVVEEVKPLREDRLYVWIDRQLTSLGKAATLEAKKRLVEIIGNDLQRIDNELEKVAIFTADRRVIDIDDVNQVCDWIKEFVGWELAENLGKRSLEKTLQVLNMAFKEGNEPEKILGIVANFFRDVVTAKLWLKEGREKKEIFATFRPQIKEEFGGLYFAKFREFFSLLDGHSEAELALILRELGQIDLAIKSTETRPQPLFERFVIEYCRRGRPKDQPEVIWRGRE